MELAHLVAAVSTEEVAILEQVLTSKKGVTGVGREGEELSLYLKRKT